MVRDVQALMDHLGARPPSTSWATRWAPSSPDGWRRANRRVRHLVLGGVGSEWGGEQRPLGTVPIADALETEDPDTTSKHPLAAAFRRFADSTGCRPLALAATQRSRHGETTDVTAISVPTLMLVGRRRPARRIRREALAETNPGLHLSNAYGEPSERRARPGVQFARSSPSSIRCRRRDVPTRGTGSTSSGP